MSPPTLTLFESSGWTTTTTPRTVDATSCLTGDYLLAIIVVNQHVGIDITDITTSTTAGSTGSWTEPQEQLSGGAETTVSSAWAQVTGDGSVTVQCAYTQVGGTAREWGFYVLRARGSSGIGNSASSASSGSSETISLDVSQDGSAVAWASGDWNAVAVGTGWTPTSDVTLVERTQGGQYTAHAAYWENQAAGTRSYGSTGAGAGLYRHVAVEIKGVAATSVHGPVVSAVPVMGRF
jgi:hypothetical protein